ncbi:hypothetical protein HNV12_07085 [Methanococcoides sp. SA1]|nr:hypothetical protein [Methanococcoides sp. SA1]
MSRKILRDLLPIEDARNLFKEVRVRTHTVSIPIERSTGRVLAEDIVSTIDVPGFDKSLRDGYAVRSEDVASAGDAPVSLKLVGFSPVGMPPQYSVGEMEAVEVATGGPIPDGADAVVMVEDTELNGDTVLVKTSVNTGKFLILAGSDISKNTCLLSRGLTIGAREVGVLAAIGMREVAVSTMKVGIISTGNELAVPGTRLQPGMVYDTNSYSLYAAAAKLGVDTIAYGLIKDDQDAVSAVVERAIGECDIVLTSGSTSAGPDDFMYDIFEEKGTVLAHGLNFKPGKPVILGMINEIPIVALPGHPTSSLTVFYEFILPLIRRNLNTPMVKRQIINAVLGEDVISGNRHELLAVRLEGGEVFSASRSSAAITTLAYADGFIEIPADVPMVKKGMEVELTLFEGAFK